MGVRTADDRGEKVREMTTRHTSKKLSSRQMTDFKINMSNNNLHVSIIPFEVVFWEVGSLSHGAASKLLASNCPHYFIIIYCLHLLIYSFNQRVLTNHHVPGTDEGVEVMLQRHKRPTLDLTKLVNPLEEAGAPVQLAWPPAPWLE